MDGFGLCKWIRDNQPSLLRYTIVASGNHENKNRFHDVYEFINKPADLNKIINTVNKVASMRRPIPSGFFISNATEDVG